MKSDFFRTAKTSEDGSTAAANGPMRSAWKSVFIRVHPWLQMSRSGQAATNQKLPKDLARSGWLVSPRPDTKPPMIICWLLLACIGMVLLVKVMSTNNPINQVLEFPLVSIISIALFFSWRAYLRKGDNRQRVQAWLKSDRRSRRVFGIVMVILSFAVFGHMIVDIGQWLFGWK